jgi:hypothetical protein
MEQEVKPQLPDINIDIIFCLSLSNQLNIEFFEEDDLVAKVGDLWIKIATISPSY